MIAVKDIAYVRFTAPDLDAMERFLTDFGLHTHVRTPERLYMRCSGPQPFVHVTEQGSNLLSQGIGFWAQSLADLQSLAAETGSAVVDNDEPGGGQRVTLKDPNGLRVDVLFGQQPLPSLPVRPTLHMNPAGVRLRQNQTVRHAAGPSTVARLGHIVLRVASFRASHDWYASLLGLRIADSFYAGHPDNRIFAFLRCGLGQTLTDHHTVALAEVPPMVPPGIDHSAFEVLDVDDLLIGNRHLQEKGYVHSWGVGRHVQGSQVFDYWRDPNGIKTEHWADGDSINDDYPVANIPIEQAAGGAIWAPPMPEDFTR